MIWFSRAATRRRLLGLVASAVVVVGSAGSTMIAAATSTTPTTPILTAACAVVPQAQLRVISLSAPCIVSVARNGVIKLSLSPGFRWSALHSSNRSVRVTSVVGPATGGLTAKATGVYVGRASLTATGVMVCPAGVACPALARLWSLVVLVRPSWASPVTLNITTVDQNRHVTLHRGDHLNLSLVGSSIYKWTPISSSAPAVLRRVSTSAGTTVRASFLAVGPGRAVVSAVDNPTCYPQCLPPSRVFQVSVLVTN
jgi:hypothetical protein